MVSEELKYIRETGEEIAALNQIIREKDEMIADLKADIARLEGNLDKRDMIIKNLRELYNEVYYKQSNLRRERDIFKQRYVAMGETLMCILPDIGKELVEDVEKDYVSRIVDAIQDKERRW